MNGHFDDAILGRLRYSEEMQESFSALSGDTNPMHVDPVAARRTLFGHRAVHGIHLALAMMEAVLARMAERLPASRAIAGFTAQFLKPVAVGETVDFYVSRLTGEDGRITGRMDEEAVCKMTVRFGPASKRVPIELPPLSGESVDELLFDELENKTGSLALGLDLSLAKRLFPLTTEVLGIQAMAETLALSRLVGMHCPGLHSIFGQAAVRYEGRGEDDVLHYRVEKTDERFGRVVLAVQGPILQGELIVFFRPPPVAQADMAAVARAVAPGSFAQSRALIVGGSRGLGEVTAKIIAAGGGFPIITYHRGAADAKKVVDDIRSHDGRCEMMPLDVAACDQAIRQWPTDIDPPQSLYYFATPKIPGRQRGFFSHDMLQNYNEIYVTAFGRLVDLVAETFQAKLKVFYPSSVLVDQGQRGMEEYIMAKRLAEEMCSYYNQHSRKIEIVVERLPRIKTDQTSALIPLPAEDALEVMLPLVRRMENSFVS
jgi:acyl dehydratase